MLKGVFTGQMVHGLTSISGQCGGPVALGYVSCYEKLMIRGIKNFTLRLSPGNMVALLL